MNTCLRWLIWKISEKKSRIGTKKSLKPKSWQTSNNSFLNLETISFFIGSQHRLIVAGEEMFADLVFFNRELNASVIVELKRGKFRANYLGQLSGYLTAYDMTEKKPHENPTIGIILCQDANRQFVEVLVRDYDKPMGVATYRTAQEMPENLRRTLPDINELQSLLSKDNSTKEHS